MKAGHKDEDVFGLLGTERIQTCDRWRQASDRPVCAGGYWQSQSQ